jgi:hypothetical protein
MLAAFRGSPGLPKRGSDSSIKPKADPIMGWPVQKTRLCIQQAVSGARLRQVTPEVAVTPSA